MASCTTGSTTSSSTRTTRCSQRFLPRPRMWPAAFHCCGAAFPGRPGKACGLSSIGIGKPERDLYSTGVSEANYWFEFSAARQTMSPHLASAENEKVFGAAASPVRSRTQLSSAPESTGRGSDARTNLSLPDVASKRTRPQESQPRGRRSGQSANHDRNLARYLHKRAGETLPVHRVRLHERSDFFAEFWGNKHSFLACAPRSALPIACTASS